jgi:hypothetical protein
VRHVVAQACHGRASCRRAVRSLPGRRRWSCIRGIGATSD